MKYVALLRGINVGGNSLVKMDALKQALTKAGFANVATYIQSGNVIFQSQKTDRKNIAKEIEKTILNSFKISCSVVVLSQDQLQEVLDNVPAEWTKQNDLRSYIAFVIEPTITADVLKEITLNEEIDFVKVGKSVLYMSTKLEGITKSGFSKLAGKIVYKALTIRNYNTTQKILELTK